MHKPLPFYTLFIRSSVLANLIKTGVDKSLAHEILVTAAVPILLAISKVLKKLLANFVPKITCFTNVVKKI